MVIIFIISVIINLLLSILIFLFAGSRVQRQAKQIWKSQAAEQCSSRTLINSSLPE